MGRRAFLQTVLPPLLLAALCTAVAYVATGPTAGFFFAGIVLATLLTPPLVVAETLRLRQLLCAASIVDGVGVVWLIALAHPLITFGDWFSSYVLLASYVLALWGLVALLRRLRLGEAGASALVTTLALMWISAPVWSSPWIAGRERLVGWFTPPHPLLALDSVFRALGPPWSERYYMYNLLSVLNQDVAYELPRGVWTAVLVHGAIGAAGLLIGWRGRGGPGRTGAGLGSGG